MTLPVSLRAVLNEIDFGTDEWLSFINRKTGELVSFPEDEIHDGGVEEIAEDRARVEASDDFVALPSQRDLHEHHIMERFVAAQPDDKVSERLERAIHGRGAFRRFKDEAHRLGVIESWYTYRDKAFARIAAAFLEAEGIAFADDVGIGTRGQGDVSS